MKKIIILFLSTLFIMIGCNDNSSILEPENDYAEQSLSKGRPILLGGSDDIILDRNLDDIYPDDDLNPRDDLTGFTLNKTIGSEAGDSKDRKIKGDLLDEDLHRGKYRNRSYSVKTKMSKNFTVDGSVGDTLYVSHRWKSKGKRVKLSAKLYIPENAYKGELTFAMIFDLENYALELYPSPFEFDIPVKLDLVFKNVDFTNLNMQNPDFVYLDGEEQMLYEKVKFDPEKGVVEVKGAELHHFSRYGWTRKK
jgi:hypothetical protein